MSCIEHFDSQTLDDREMDDLRAVFKKMGLL